MQVLRMIENLTLEVGCTVYIALPGRLNEKNFPNLYQRKYGAKNTRLLSVIALSFQEACVLPFSMVQE